MPQNTAWGYPHPSAAPMQSTHFVPHHHAAQHYDQNHQFAHTASFIGDWGYQGYDFAPHSSHKMLATGVNALGVAASVGVAGLGAYGAYDIGKRTVGYY
jgi:hypothetical protein